MRSFAISGLTLARALALSVLCAILPADAATERDARVERYLAAVAADLPLDARAVLPSIDNAPRRLLAVRGYLRAGEKLATRWSWSAQQIAIYETTDEYRELLAEVEHVQARFESGNPGYSLYANTQTRSLDLQLQRWNENTSVGAIARVLHQAVGDELRAGGYPQHANAAAAQKLAEFVRSWRPPRAIPLAAPGLSLHGQSRAIDFQVVKGDAVIAGTKIADVARVWERQGWARKLNAAVAGSRFAGPLQSPNEPWHYEYVPHVPFGTGAPSRTEI